MKSVTVTIKSILNQLLNKKLICYISFVTNAKFSINSSEIGLTLDDIRGKSKSFTVKQIQAEIVDIEISAGSHMFETDCDIYITMSLKYNDVIYDVGIDIDEELNII